MKPLSERLEATAKWEDNALRDGNAALLREAAELARRYEGAAKTTVRGKVGELATVHISHSLAGQRVRIVPEAPGV